MHYLTLTPYKCVILMKHRRTHGLSLPPVTMRPSLSVVYIVNTGPV